jgi:ribonuclease HI
MQIYTDGSRTNERTGYGGFLSLKGKQEEQFSQPLGKWATVNQAEMAAIIHAANTAANMATGATGITIYSDSQVSLRALKNDHTTSKLVKECNEMLNRLGNRCAVTLRWVPGHQGVIGNELADGMAKEGANTPFTGPEPSLPVSENVIKTETRKWFRQSWQTSWEELETCRQSKLNITRTDAPELLSMTRQHLRHLITVLTGHGNLGHHLQRMGINQNPMCQECGAMDEDAEHFIARCPKYADKRYIVFGRHVLHEGEWRTASYSEMSKFIERTGRLSKRYP